MHKTLLRVALVAALFTPLSVLLPNVAFADTVQVNFENPPYTVGNINNQDGWMKTGTFDANVIASGVANFGSQSLQISDAVTSGSFGDQTFAKPLTNAVGETTATAGTFSVGAKQPHFEMQFDLASAVPGAQQPGETMSVSPDRGDGSRMSYLRFEDQADGIHVFFDDVTDTTFGTAATFNESDIATLNRSVSHTIKLTLDTIDGAANDVVKVYIDGTLKKTGGSWEDYYRNDPESATEQSPRIVKTVLFRESATANATDAGKGYLVDNLTLSSGPTPTSSTVVVTPSDTHSWITDDTRPGGAVNFVTDASTPSGTGALQLTTDNTTTSKAQYMQYVNGVPTPLTSVTELSYYTKQNSALFAGGDASYQLPVMLNGTTGFTTFVFEPYENGTVIPGTWQHWDVAKGQFWSSKSITCSNGAVVAGFGGAPFYTLAQIETMCPSAAVTGFGVNIGSNNPGYDVETDLVSFNGTAYNFEPAPAAPTTVTVTIEKYVDAQHATAANANSAIFPFTANYQASNVLGGNPESDPFTIGPVGNGTPNAYEANTIPLATGASYSAAENVSGNNVVGATCTDGKPFALAGYSSGNTFTEAFANASSSTVAPAFTNLTSDKVVIVWNKTCPVAPPATFKVHVLKYLNNAEATAASANNYQFPMSSTWSATNIGAGTGSYVLGTNFGGAASLYGADTAAMTGPYNYVTSEIADTADSQVVSSQALCAPGKYVLQGYKSSPISFADASVQGTSADPIAFNAVASDEYVLVYNTTCPTTATLTVYKNTIGGNGTFTFTGTNGIGSFQITTAAGTGNKVIANLAPGTYTVTEGTVAGWTQTDTTCTSVPLVAGDNVSCTITNTNNTKLGAIRGTKFEDWDADGSAFETKWEVGLAGFTIYLDTNNNGVKDAGEPSTVTDSHGVYSFLGLPAGTYHVREVQQTGWTQTYPSVNVANDKYDIVLAAGQIAKKKDFGNFKLGSIAGTVYNDKNNNGNKGANEVGLAGWTVKAKSNNGFTATTVSDANGNYSFSNLPEGNYTLTETTQSGWKLTDKPGTIKVRSATVSTKDNFGNYKK